MTIHHLPTMPCCNESFKHLPGDHSVAGLCASGFFRKNLSSSTAATWYAISYKSCRGVVKVVRDIRYHQPGPREENFWYDSRTVLQSATDDLSVLCTPGVRPKKYIRFLVQRWITRKDSKMVIRHENAPEVS